MRDQTDSRTLPLPFPSPGKSGLPPLNAWQLRQLAAIKRRISRVPKSGSR
ncbi:hypothetical protein FHT32_004372 [Variovorax sp. SG517]|nr:hypothetical protein [Variovorax sp. SG517]